MLAPERHRITQVLTGGARVPTRSGTVGPGETGPWQGFKAEWERFGKSAGMRRNHQMAQAGDVLVALGTTTPGTAHVIQCIRALGKPVVVVSIDTTA